MILSTVHSAMEGDLVCLIPTLDIVPLLCSPVHFMAMEVMGMEDLTADTTQAIIMDPLMTTISLLFLTIVMVRITELGEAVQ